MGFVQIDHELFDAVATAGFNASERAVMDCLIRYSIGFQRESCEASAGYISKYSGINIRSIQRATSDLTKKNVIIPDRTLGMPTVWKINSPDLWELGYDRNDVRLKCRRGYGSNVVGGTTEMSQGVRLKCVTRNKGEIKEEIKGERKDSHPTLEDIKAICEEEGCTFDPEDMYLYYENKGWDGIKKLKAAVLRWQKMENRFNKKKDEDPEVPSRDDVDEWGRPIRKREVVR